MPKNATVRRIDRKAATLDGATIFSSGSGGVGGGVSDHGLLTGLSDDDHAHYYNQARGDARYVRQTVQVISGAGLTGGAALSGDVTLVVGAGNGITVNADDVALASSVAGDGLTYTSGVLDVVSANTGIAIGANALTLTLTSDSGLVISSGLRMGTPLTLTVSTTNARSGADHSHAITSSSSPGAAASLLATDASGFLTLVKLVATTKVTTPLIDASSGLAITPTGALTINPTGDITIAPGGLDVIVDQDSAFRADNYLAGFPLAGFKIGPTSISGQSGVNAGVGEFDELRARIFVADETRVDRGQEYITKSYGILAAPFDVPVSGGDTELIYFENSPHIAGAIFTDDDWIMLRWLDMSSGIVLSSVWGQVDTYTGFTDYQRWVFTLRNRGGLAGAITFPESAMAVNFGASGQGYILSDAVTTDAPFVQIGRWDGANPYTPANRTVTTQIGKLDGVGFTGEYGLAASIDGFTSTDEWIKASTGGVTMNNVNAEWYNSGDLIVQIDATEGVRVNAQMTTYNSARAYRFIDDAGDDIGGLYGFQNGASSTLSLFGNFDPGTSAPLTTNGNLRLEGFSLTGGTAQVNIRALEESTSNAGTIDLTSAGGGSVSFSPQMRGASSSASAPAYSFSSDTNTGMWNSSTDQLTLTTGGVNRLSVNSTGAVIAGDLTGVTDITATGDIASSTVAVDTGATGSGYRFTGGISGIYGTGSGFAIEQSGTDIWRSVTSNADSFLRIGYNNANDRSTYLDFFADGSSPTSQATRVIRNSGANGILDIIQTGTGGIRYRNLAVAPHVWRINDAEVMRIHTDERVGIGTASPDALLDVDGFCRALSFYADDDGGSVSGTLGITNVSSTTISTGVGSIRTSGTTARTNTHWIKVYAGTTTVWIPAFSTITG
jgi:hypothetical protein